MNIRPALAADCPALAALDAACNPSPWSAKQFQTALTARFCTVLLAEYETEHAPAAFIVWQTVAGESELHLVATAPAARRRGFADTLLRLAQFGPSGMPKFVLPTVRDNLAAGGPIRLGAAMCAAWSLGAAGTDENGDPIPVADDLRPLAERQEAGEETAFIANEEIFGDLAENERFRTTYLEELAALRSQGARARMRELVAEA